MNLSITDSGKLGEKVVISITVSSLAIDSTNLTKWCYFQYHKYHVKIISISVHILLLASTLCSLLEFVTI